MVNRIGRLRWLAVVIGSLALLALLSACGGGEKEGKAVKVGLLNPKTAVFAPNGDQINKGFYLYLELHDNKLGGHPVTVVEEDTESAATPGLTKARKLLEQDKVDILVGVVSSAVAAAMRDYVAGQPKPWLITTAAANIFTQHSRAENIFRSSPNAGQLTYPAGDWVCKNTPYRKVVLIAQDYLFGWEAAGPFARSFTSACGTIVQELYPPLTATDFGPFFLQLDKSADAVAASVVGANAIPFLKQYREFGINKPLITLGGTTTETFLRTAGPEAVGVLATLSYGAQVDTPENRQFVEAYRKKYGGQDPDLYTYNGWTGAVVLDAALKEVKDPSDHEALKRALRKVQATTLTGSIRFDEYQQVVATQYVARVEKVGDRYQNTIIATYPGVSQFWTFKPQEMLAGKPYAELKGTWVKK